MDEIVVGFDGSEPSMHAVRWAASEALRRHLPVRVVQSWRERAIGGPSLAEAWMDPDAEQRAATAEMEAFVGAVHRESPDLEITAELMGDRPADVLIAASAEASLLVVGSRGRGGFSSLLLGSVSRKVAAAATCPVAVVRGASWTSGPIVVGIDGTAASRAALAWAADAAIDRCTSLRAVLAWTDLVPIGDHGPEPLRAGYTETDARATLRRIVEEVLDGRANLDLHLEVSAERPARVLLEAAEDASLLVVGSSGITGRLGDLGSVTWQVLHHAPCSVVVVPAPAS